MRRDSLLSSIEKRVLWLATNIVHHANYVRENAGGMKVGGHQTSSASVVTILTALYFDFLRAGDKVSIKPHASPVFHAIQYLVGNLDAHYLTTLRKFQGLQAYPSRTKDPDAVDFSTGSVGIGSIAPNFAALVALYLESHGSLGGAPRTSEIGEGLDRPTTAKRISGRRFVSLVGDAELDEGSVWEAIAEPILHDLDNLLWVVDLNRQSLDRVIQGIRVRSWREMFAANGWTVIDVKYGELLAAAFALPNGELLKNTLDDLSNEAYQRLLRLPGPDLREWLPKKCRFPRDLARFISRWDDAELQSRFRNLGGHDFGALRSAFNKVEATRGPCVIFAYTLKGRGLPTVGHPQNHSALLTSAQIESLKNELGIVSGEEWAAFPAGTPEARLCAEVGDRLRCESSEDESIVQVPNAVGCVHTGKRSTQQAFGVILTAIAREAPDIAQRLVTISPDVASSTNLGGWINKFGVWKTGEAPEVLPEETETSGIRWVQSAEGKHVELGISENNLFMALGQFGLSKELFGQLLIPVGTLYDPFVRRGLDAFFYSVYSGARFIVVGTPSGITLAPEGGAHQSIGSQSIGTELPELDFYEPCFGEELEWIFMHAISRQMVREAATYLRLSTRLVDQQLFHSVEVGRSRRDQVIRGGYRIVDRSHEKNYHAHENVVNVFACGALVPEAIAASDALLKEGILANVFNVTGPGPLYRDFQLSRTQAAPGEGEECHLERLVPGGDRAAPAVTVIDDHPHALAWIGGALGSKVYPLGVTRFGQSGSVAELYAEYGVGAENIAATCRRALKSAMPSPALKMSGRIP